MADKPIKLQMKRNASSINEQGCVKLDKEARAMVVAVIAQTGYDAKYVVSEIVKQAIGGNLVDFGKEED